MTLTTIKQYLQGMPWCLFPGLIAFSPGQYPLAYSRNARGTRRALSEAKKRCV